MSLLIMIPVDDSSSDESGPVAVLSNYTTIAAATS